MPATITKIQEALGPDSPFNYGEKFVIRAQYGDLGHFYAALWNAITRADEHNLDRLAQGFPAEVAGFRSWAYGDLGTRIREWGLDI